MRKFKKRYKKIIFLTNIVILWCFLLITIMQLNSFTNASFNDVEELSSSLHVNWPVDEWDKSSLDFDKGSLQRGGTCNPPYIFAEIYNDGEDMTFSTWSWELFEVGNGNLSKTPIGPSLDNGVVPKILSDKKGKIESSGTISSNGNYRFKVTKTERPGQDTIWSEKIEISGCSSGKEKKENSFTTDNNNETSAETKMGKNVGSGSSPNNESTTNENNTKTQKTEIETESTEEINNPELEEAEDIKETINILKAPENIKNSNTTEDLERKTVSNNLDENE
nr:amyloid fiber anchoring/assembly protein TapA [Pseudoneobacillus rhizosphaerae]